MSREAEFAAQFWKKLDEYLARYSVDGNKLFVKEPNSVVLKGKIPDIVVVNVKGIPQLIIETKRKAVSTSREELLNPLSPAPIAQTVCYALLATEEYGLERTPLFATANKDSLILFKGIDKDDIDKIVYTKACLESKRTPEDWVKALKPGGLKLLLQNYIIDRIEYPLKDESIKKLLDYVGKWVIRTKIPPAVFYRIFVDQLRGSIENLHAYVKDAVKAMILSDREYFTQLFKKAKKMGYRFGLLSKGLFELKCPSRSRKICEYLKEIIEKQLGSVEMLDPDKVFEILSRISKIHVVELCSEARKAKGIDISSIPLCREAVRVDDLISFDNLTKMMAYVLTNKILAYKILEFHYGDHIPTLKPVRYGDTIKINNQLLYIRSPNNLVEFLNYVFSHASVKLEELLRMKDFSPIFNTGLYDDIILGGIESIDKVNVIIDLMDVWKQELKYLTGIIGFVYEGLLPPRERHQLGAVLYPASYS